MYKLYLFVTFLLAFASTSFAQPDFDPKPKTKPVDVKKADPKKVGPKAEPKVDPEFTDDDAAKVAAGFLGFSITFIVVVAVISCCIQLIPIFIAFMRDHPDKIAIAALSLLLGCTFVGWVAALVWSLTGIEHRRRRYGR